MNATRLKFGIPDVELPRRSGGTVNPASFAGHVLVVLFCPTAPESEAAELAAYRALAPKLSDYDGWLLTVSEREDADQSGLEPFMAAALDTQGSAWSAFREIAPAGLDLKRAAGATYLFGRGCALQRVWPGSGHAVEVLEEVTRPCFGNAGSRDGTARP